MLSHVDLRQHLLSLDRQGYRGYRGIEGAYRFPQFTLSIDHAQSDPFAPPSRVRATMGMREAGYPPDIVASSGRRTSLADYLTRSFARALRRLGARDISIDAGGQEILERTAAAVWPDRVELRFTVRLPAAGRSILGREAARLLTETLDEAIMTSVPWPALDSAAVWQHVRTVEDAQALRAQLEQNGLVAFLADGSILPRRSGASDLPMTERAVPFESPPELRVVLHAPHAGQVVGMGIPRGVTLIVGGGYHGKTTLLQALQAGVYDHVPGDGREHVVTLPDAVKVRAEDGRRVERVDISPFLTNLPVASDTTCFTTDNASGSTSQAAAIMEALEVGTGLLLLDEDTSATNFMVRDDLMQQLIPPELEPITPFIDRIRELSDRGTSTILVVGGDGDYFEVADRVIGMERYRPRDVTDRARQIIQRRRDARRREVAGPFHPPVPRIPLPDSLNAHTRRGSTRVAARDLDEIRFGREEIDLQSLDQLVDLSQTRAIAAALLYIASRGFADGRRTVREVLQALTQDIDSRGLGVITSDRFDAPPGDLARPRAQEIAAALNRLRSLQARQAR